MCVRQRERRKVEGGARSSENQGVVVMGRERCYRKGSQQSLYRFEDRLQSSIVAILRNPNNLSLVRTTARATYYWNRNLQPLVLPSGQYSLFSVTRSHKKIINESFSLSTQSIIKFIIGTFVCYLLS